MFRKPSTITDAQRGPPRPQRISAPIATLLRMFLLGSVAVAASIWAIWRYYTVPLAPMVVPVPSVSAPASSSSEIEVETAPP